MSDSMRKYTIDAKTAFNRDFLFEDESDEASLNIIKRRLHNYEKYLVFKHVEKNKESAKALKIRKNTRYLEIPILKINEKIYNTNKLEGIKQFWIDCIEWRKDENNREYLLGYQDFYEARIKFFSCEEDAQDFDSEEEIERIEQETSRLEWMIGKER